MLASARASTLRSALAALVAVSVFAVQANPVDQTAFSAQDIARIEQLGPWPQPVPDDPGNALSGEPWAESLGEVLFSDTRLSGSGQRACISCHIPARGFSDPLPVAIGAAPHVRNTQGLWNVALQRWFGWDGGADSLWSATLRPLLSDIEMAGDVETLAAHYRRDPGVMAALGQFAATRGTTDISDTELVVFLSKSIAAYLRTLSSPRTRFDQFRDDLLSGNVVGQATYPEAAKRGLKRFVGKANCFVCHAGPNFSNGEFHDIGRPFFTGVGEVDGGRYSGLQRLKHDPFNLLGRYADSPRPNDLRKSDTVTIGQVNFGQWRTPSLRNVQFTAPYMHDGSLATLADVIDHYSDIDPTRLHSQGEAILRPLALDDTERNDLVQFLLTLSEPARD